MKAAKIKIKHPTKGLIPFEPRKYQQEWMQDFSLARATLKARQIGMSQTVAIEHAHNAVWHEGYTGLIVSKNLDAALEVIEYAKIAIESATVKPNGLKVIVDNKTSIELSNKSRIKAIPASKNAGRSIAASKVTIDEFAVMLWANEIYQAIGPTISTGGSIDVLFSPKGRANLAYLLWNGDLGQNFSKHRIHWTQNPAFYTPEEMAAGIPPNECKWYKENRPNYTAQAWAEEFECDFAQSGQTVFKEEDVEAVFNPELLLPEPPVFGAEYISFWDIGRKRDPTVGTTYRVMREPKTGKLKKRIVAWERYEGLPYPKIAEKIDERGLKYKGKNIVESNSIGDPVLEMCRTKVEGQFTGGKSKIDMITALQLDLENRRLEAPLIAQLRAELLMYQWDDEKLIQDCVISASGCSNNSSALHAPGLPVSGGQRPNPTPARGVIQHRVR